MLLFNVFNRLAASVFSYFFQNQALCVLDVEAINLLRLQNIYAARRRVNIVVYQANTNSTSDE